MAKINPAVEKMAAMPARSSEAVLARTKTDATDARRIARFCETHALAPWRPTSPAHQRLHALGATRQALLQQRQQLRHRQGAAGYPACQALIAEPQAPVAAALTARLARGARELAQLAAAETPPGTQLRVLVSIPGLGRTTAATILASLPAERLPTRRQVAADAGRCPRERPAGASVRGRRRTGPRGPAARRKALDLPAVVALRAHPALRAFAARLRAAGKGPKVVVVAVMRKLLVLAWTLLRRAQPYAPGAVASPA